MDEIPLYPHSWQQFIWIALASLLTYLATHLPSLVRPRQSKAEELKTAAEARSIDINAVVVAGEAMTAFIKEMAQATIKVEQLRGQKEFWQAKAAAETARADLAERQLDKRIRIGDGENDRI